MGFQVYNSQGQELQNLTGSAGGDLTGTYPNPDIAAGAVGTAEIASAVGNFGAWTSYTPTWTASTNPAIGNGTLEGSYVKIGRFVAGRIRIIGGSTSTYGSGDYNFGLPVTAGTGVATYTPVGTGTAEDVGVAIYVGFAYLSSSSALRVITPTASGNWNKTVPFTFGTSDVFYISFFYEAA